MNQIFKEHLPYMIVGIIIGTVLVCIPRQTKRSMRISRIIGLATGLYPLCIIALYLGRSYLGESYAYLIFGGVVAILLGLIVGGLFIAWIVLYALDFPWEIIHRR